MAILKAAGVKNALCPDPVSYTHLHLRAQYRQAGADLSNRLPQCHGANGRAEGAFSQAVTLYGNQIKMPDRPFCGPVSYTHLFGCTPEELNLASDIHSPDHSTKGTISRIDALYVLVDVYKRQGLEWLVCIG